MRTKPSISPIRYSAGILFFLFISCTSYAQHDTTSRMENAIYFEMGGAGGSHSMNYERLFKLIPLLDLNARIGIGFDNFVDYNGNLNPDVALPVMATVMYGKNHKVEGGVGQTFSNTIETNIHTGEPARMSNFSTTFYIGYRYQNPAKRLLVRAGYSPYIEFNENYKHWLGVSIGFMF
jgi:hypothetical protein